MTSRIGLDINVSLYGAGNAGALSLGLMNNVSGEWAHAIAATIPRRRLGTPEDIGAAVAFLSSDAADWITGQLIPVNGGSHT